MYEYILFDLDGTLTDPKEGITRCVQYALRSLGIEEPDLNKLESFIGPPLKESFMDFYGLTESQAEQAIVSYRERFQDTGIYENEIYQGIPKLLKQLKSKGSKLAVASSKPTVYVHRILAYFHIDAYFDVVVGSELDGRRVNKEEVIEEALKQLYGENDIDYDRTVMIGDRKFDIEGAKKYNLVSIGVAYGYGSRKELEKSKPDIIVTSVTELKKVLLDSIESLPQKIWHVLFPFLLYAVIVDAVRIIGMYVAISIAQTAGGTIAEWLLVTDRETGVYAGLTGGASAVIQILSFMAAYLVLYRTASADIWKRHNRQTHMKGKDVFMVLVLTTSATIAFNLFSILIRFITLSSTYAETASRQYMVPFPLGILLYGLISPLAEELLFRGIMYNRIKYYTAPWIAGICSAAAFGIYHQNLVQAVYGFIMGCLFAGIYERYGKFYVPVLCHAAANLTAYLLTYFQVLEGNFTSWPTCAAACILLIGSGIYICRGSGS